MATAEQRNGYPTHRIPENQPQAESDSSSGFKLKRPEISRHTAEVNTQRLILLATVIGAGAYLVGGALHVIQNLH